MRIWERVSRRRPNSGAMKERAHRIVAGSVRFTRARAQSLRKVARTAQTGARSLAERFEIHPLRGTFGIVALVAALLILNTSQIEDAVNRMFEVTRFGFSQTLLAIEMLLLLVGAWACLLRWRSWRWGRTICIVYIVWSLVLYAVMLGAFLAEPLGAARLFVAPVSILVFINTFPALMLIGDVLPLRRWGALPASLWMVACLFALFFPSQEDVAQLITSPDKDGVQRVSPFMERENRLVLENRHAFRERGLDETPIPLSPRTDFCTVRTMLARYKTQSLRTAFARAQEGSDDEGKTTDRAANEQCLEYLAAFEEENSSGRHPEIRESFRAWLGSRPDKIYYDARGRKYPVFLVAAQGGGIYAGAHASLFLAQIQTLCPSFADHLFAISSVSGGSVGSAVFASALAAQARQSRSRPDCPLDDRTIENSPLLEQAKAFASADHLSVLVGAMLTTDLWSDILPFLPQRKRGQAMIESFESTLTPAAKGFWHKGVAGAWTPDGNVPALLINTTEVDLGRRLVLAPFSSRTLAEPDFPFFSRHLGDQYFIDGNDYKRGLTIGSAAMASARFPFVTGSLTIPMGLDLTPDDPSDPIAVQLVDGGYYDNSGGETLEELVRLLNSRFGDKVEFHVIAFAGTDQDRALTPLHPAWAPSREEPSSMYFTNLRHNNVPWSDALSPGRTFMTSRGFRGQLALERLNDVVSGACAIGFATDCIVRKNFLRFTLDDRKLELPLGWTLSDKKVQTILRQRPSASRCKVSLVDGGYVMDQTMGDIGSSRLNEIMSTVMWDFRDPKDRARDEQDRRERHGRNLLPEEFKAIFEGVAGKEGSSDCALVSLREILMDTYRSDPKEGENNREALERIYVERWFGQTGTRIKLREYP